MDGSTWARCWGKHVCDQSCVNADGVRRFDAGAPCQRAATPHRTPGLRAGQSHGLPTGHSPQPVVAVGAGAGKRYFLKMVRPVPARAFAAARARKTVPPKYTSVVREACSRDSENKLPKTLNGRRSFFPRYTPEGSSLPPGTDAAQNPKRPEDAGAAADEAEGDSGDDFGPRVYPT